MTKDQKHRKDVLSKTMMIANGRLTYKEIANLTGYKDSEVRFFAWYNGFSLKKVYNNREVKPVLKKSACDEYSVCKHYGCGRKLSMREKLFGQNCINHSKNS